MNTNVNLEAALGVLLFLGAGFCLAVAGVVAAHALVTRRPARARRALLAACALVLVYAWAMLAFSFVSRHRVLARGEEKYFCEVDCHLAYSVVSVRASETLGAPPHEARAAGRFYVVTVRTRFDEQTISPRRGDAPLTPNKRAAAMIDEDGRRYEVSEEGRRALELSGEAGTPFTAPLRPGESYMTKLVFDLPEDVKRPALLISEAGAATRFIVGHENSLFHRKTMLAVESPSL